MVLIMVPAGCPDDAGEELALLPKTEKGVSWRKISTDHDNSFPLRRRRSMISYDQYPPGSGSALTRSK
jgi:hypothetical protein